MLIRKFATPAAASMAGLIIGLGGAGPAAATEVVIAYGDAAVRQVEAFDAEFRARMDRNARHVDQTIRANVEREVERITVPVIRLAVSEMPKRG